MNERQMTISYGFDTYKDLTYKANVFVQKIDKLENLGEELVAFIKDEVSKGEGEITEAIMETAIQHEEQNKIYHDSHKIVMRNMAKYYTDFINDINRQKISIYYQVIERNID